jgi:lysozyme
MQALRTAAASPLVRKLAATFVISAAGLTAITLDEGEVRKVYLDPVGIPTVCVGHTATVKASDLGKSYSAETCQYLLRQDTSAAQSAVQKLVKVPITQGQFDALVSFTFNVGESNLRKSTLLRQINAGNCWAAGAEFPKWNKARGQVLRGLTKRRAHERVSWEAGCEPRNT